MDTTTNHHARRRAVLAALLVTGLAPGLAACGDSSAETGAPTGTGGSGADTRGPDDSGSGSLAAREARWRTALDAYDVKLAGCLREAGFDVPDPEPGQGITQSGGGIEAAAATCRKGELGDPPLRPRGTPREEAQAAREGEAKTREAVRCLTERGYDVEDPAANDGALIVPEAATQQDVDECAGA